MSLHPVYELEKCPNCGSKIESRVEKESGWGTFICEDGCVESVPSAEMVTVTGDPASFYRHGGGTTVGNGGF